MDGRDLARDSPSRSESRGDSVLSGRGVGCLDAISRSDLGRACSPAQGACDGIARQRGRHVGSESARTPGVSVASETDSVARGDCVPGTVVETSSASACRRSHGSSTTAYVEENDGLHYQSTTTLCVLSTKVFPGLEPR